MRKEVREMIRQAASMLLRLGTVLLVIALLSRMLPMPNKADLVGDDLAIIASGALVVMMLSYLRLTKGE